MATGVHQPTAFSGVTPACSSLPEKSQPQSCPAFGRSVFRRNQPGRIPVRRGFAGKKRTRFQKTSLTENSKPTTVATARPVMRLSRGKIKSTPINANSFRRRLSYSIKRMRGWTGCYLAYLDKMQAKEQARLAERMKVEYKMPVNLLNKIIRGANQDEFDRMVQWSSIDKQTAQPGKRCTTIRLSPKSDQATDNPKRNRFIKLKRLKLIKPWRRKLDMTNAKRSQPTIVLKSYTRLNEDGDKLVDHTTIDQARDMVCKVNDLIFTLDKVHFHRKINDQLAERRSVKWQAATASGECLVTLMRRKAELDAAIAGYTAELNPVFLEAYMDRSKELIELSGHDPVLKKDLNEYIASSATMTESDRKDKLDILRHRMIESEKVDAAG